MIRQFHSSKGSPEISILLGKFDEKLHKEYFDKNPHIFHNPKEKRSELIHFYQGGGECHETGKLRQVEVHLKCPTKHLNPATVVLFLLEPNTCEYTLGVESMFFCSIIDKADKYDLLKNEDIAMALLQYDRTEKTDKTEL